MRKTRALVGLAIAAGIATPVVTSGSPVSATTSICSTETPAKVGAALGLKVTKGYKGNQGDVTECTYWAGGKEAVIIAIEPHGMASNYQATFKSLKSLGEHPKVVKTFAPYRAFDTWIGSPALGYTFAVVVLEGITVISVVANGSTLVRVDGLVKTILSLE